MRGQSIHATISESKLPTSQSGPDNVKIFHWFDVHSVQAFAGELAAFILAELNHPKVAVKDAKFMDKAQKTLGKAAIRLQNFKATHPLNFYKRARLANQFLWALRDGGCPQAYADELTEWLTLRL